jgi:hypothetical protein
MIQDKPWLDMTQDEKNAMWDYLEPECRDLTGAQRQILLDRAMEALREARKRTDYNDKMINSGGE